MAKELDLAEWIGRWDVAVPLAGYHELNRRIRELERELSIAKGNNAARMDGLADAIAKLERARPAAVAAMPAGYVLVPMEPTPRMVTAAINQRDDNCDIIAGRKPYPELETKRAYRAMIAAAEAPNAEGRK